jgi:hypothetical protein
MAVSVLRSPRVTNIDRVRGGTQVRRDVLLLLNVALPTLLIISFLSGWAASMLGLTEFGLHKWSSIAVFVIALAHLALHWRSFLSHIGRLHKTSTSRY